MLYIHTGSPSVTNLTYNDQSRTLTCTSTGGPATTVTWRRNGVVITLGATYHQTKNLVDSVNGTYQTVLTIDSSVGLSGFVGNYNCTVENIRGTSSKSVFVGETYFLLFLFAITLSLTFHLCDSHVTVMWQWWDSLMWQSCDHLCDSLMWQSHVTVSCDSHVTVVRLTSYCSSLPLHLV